MSVNASIHQQHCLLAQNFRHHHHHHHHNHKLLIIILLLFYCAIAASFRRICHLYVFLAIICYVVVVVACFCRRRRRRRRRHRRRRRRCHRRRHRCHHRRYCCRGIYRSSCRCYFYRCCRHSTIVIDVFISNNNILYLITFFVIINVSIYYHSLSSSVHIADCGRWCWCDFCKFVLFSIIIPQSIFNIVNFN